VSICIRYYSYDKMYWKSSNPYFQSDGKCCCNYNGIVPVESLLELSSVPL
jgi:hypothetical protein